MKKVNIVKENKDFNRIIKDNKPFKYKDFIIYLEKREQSVYKFGFSVGKKIGNAVERNRCRRIIRAAFREISPMLNGGYDFVFVARTRTIKKKSTDIKKIMLQHLKKAGVIEQ